MSDHTAYNIFRRDPGVVQESRVSNSPYQIRICSSVGDAHLCKVHRYNVLKWTVNG